MKQDFALFHFFSFLNMRIQKNSQHQSLTVFMLIFLARNIETMVIHDF